MTTEKEMDERVKKGFSVVNQKTCLKTRYTTIAITNETMDKLKTLKDKLDRQGEYLTNNEIINLVLNAYESILNRPDDNRPLELGWGSYEWKGWGSYERKGWGSYERNTQ